MASESDNESSDYSCFDEDHWQLERQARMDMMLTAVRAGNLAAFRDALDGTFLGTHDPSVLMHHATNYNQPGIMRCLLEHGGNVHAICVWRTVTEAPMEIFEVMAEYGYNFVATKNQKNVFLPHVLPRRDLVDWLLYHGADINTGPSAVRVSLAKCSVEEQSDRDHACAVLGEAAALGDIELFDYLVSRGADVKRSIALHETTQCKDPDKTTAMIAHLVEKHHFELDADDDCNGLRYFFGEPSVHGSPLRYAVCRRNAPALEALARHGARKTQEALYAALRMDWSAGARILLAMPGVDATTSCWWAVWYGNVEVVRFCLDAGADAHAVEEMDARKVLDGMMCYMGGVPYPGMSAEIRQLLRNYHKRQMLDT